jgi:hypothetical protein
VEHDPEREDVGAPVHRQPAHHLRAHVAELAAEHGPRRPGAEGRLRDAEVDDPDAAVEAEEDVGRRDVAVDDPQLAAAGVAAAVRVIEGVGDAPADVGDERDRQPLPRAARRVDEAPQLDPGDVVHGDVVARPLPAELLHRHHARVVELHDEPRLVEEHPDELLVLGEGGQDPLHGVRPSRRIAGADRREDLRHPAHRHAVDEQERAERDGLAHPRLSPETRL